MAKNGTVAFVTTLPECGVCKYTGTESEKQSPAKAVADIKLKSGSWAFVCEEHLKSQRLHPDFGVGKGQALEVRK